MPSAVRKAVRGDGTIGGTWKQELVGVTEEVDEEPEGVGQEVVAAKQRRRRARARMGEVAGDGGPRIEAEPFGIIGMLGTPTPLWRRQ